jgi:hypothetical protein
VILHFSLRLSIIDERCRKLAQEIALEKMSARDKPNAAASLRDVPGGDSCRADAV